MSKLSLIKYTSLTLIFQISHINSRHIEYFKQGKETPLENPEAFPNFDGLKMNLDRTSRPETRVNPMRISRGRGFMEDESRMNQELIQNTNQNNDGNYETNRDSEHSLRDTTRNSDYKRRFISNILKTRKERGLKSARDRLAALASSPLLNTNTRDQNGNAFNVETSTETDRNQDDIKQSISYLLKTDKSKDQYNEEEKQTRREKLIENLRLLKKLKQRNTQQTLDRDAMIADGEFLSNQQPSERVSKKSQFRKYRIIRRDDGKAVLIKNRPNISSNNRPNTRDSIEDEENMNYQLTSTSRVSKPNGMNGDEQQEQGTTLKEDRMQVQQDQEHNTPKIYTDNSNFEQSKQKIINMVESIYKIDSSVIQKAILKKLFIDNKVQIDDLAEQADRLRRSCGE